MTEAEWIACESYRDLAHHLGHTASNRKRRLFACACCHHIWGLLLEERSRSAVAVAERLAEGLIVSTEAERARQEAKKADREMFAGNPVSWQGFAARAAAATLYKRPADTLRTAHEAAWAVAVFSTPEEGYGHRRQALLNAQYAKYARIMRDIFGNPFRPATVDPSLLRWNDGTIPKIAQAIYEKGAFDRLPILHDALLDAGCDNEDILAHCRSEGPHVRGCWVIDALLGKS